MGKLESWITFALLAAIFLAAWGCSNKAGESPVISGGDELPGIMDATDDAASEAGTISYRGELEFDLINADYWVDTAVLPGSTHYFSYTPEGLGHGPVITWEANGGYFVDGTGAKSTTMITGPGELVSWVAPVVGGSSDVGVRASGPDGSIEDGIELCVDAGAAGGRTAQPYHATIFIDDSAGGKIEVADGELLVGFSPGADIRTCNSVFDTLSVEPIALVDAGEGIYRVRVPEGMDLVTARSEMSANSEVAFAEYNYIYRLAHAEPNDTFWSGKWDLVRMDILDAWDIEEGSSDVIVAVIDTGVDLNHPDLANRVIDGADFVSGGDGKGGEVDGDGIDNNLNGWTDESVGHGTHVAGIIGARSFNGIGTVGVNIDVTILPLRVFPVDGDSGASTSSISSAISYAVSHGAKVINMSLGGPYYSSTLDIAVTNGVEAGVTVACAAGNSGVEQVFYPAGYTGAIAVAAISSSDAKCSFSNYGTWVDICAPGSGIHSTLYNDTYAYYSGTSMATPEVAGVAALIWAYRPDFTEAEVREALLSGADESVYDANPGYTGKLGSGCTDAFGSLEYCGEPEDLEGFDNPLEEAQRADDDPQLMY